MMICIPSESVDETKTKTILIAGYYGFGNVGDEAILSAMLAGLRGRLSGRPCHARSKGNIPGQNFQPAIISDD